MTGRSDDFADQSWTFLLRIYEQPGVAEACLRLQEEAGADIVLLLASVFAARRGITLSPSDHQAMAAQCRPWREQVVQPLRALRISLKDGPTPAPSKTTAALREQIKASELHAERIESDMLADWLQQKPAGPATPDKMQVRLRLGIAAHLATENVSAEAFSASIDAIAAAAIAL